MSNRNQGLCAISAWVGLMLCTPLPGMADGIQVIDANARVVGPYENGAVFVSVGGRPTAIALEANHHNPAWLIYKEADLLFFANADCTGTAYILSYDGVPGAMPSVVQHRADGQYLFMADSRKLESTVTAQSHSAPDGACTGEQTPLSKVYPSSSAPAKLPYVEPFAVN
jgi:hypothetical protein